MPIDWSKVDPVVVGRIAELTSNPAPPKAPAITGVVARLEAIMERLEGLERWLEMTPPYTYTFYPGSAPVIDREGRIKDHWAPPIDNRHKPHTPDDDCPVFENFEAWKNQPVVAWA